MAKTPQDLATRALHILRKLEAQEEASTEDAADVVDLYSRKHAEWTFEELAWWPLAEIPDMAFDHVAKIIAQEVAPEFGAAVPTEMDRNGDVISIGVAGYRGLKRLIARERTGTPVQAQCF